MELSSEVTDGLQVAGSSAFNDEDFKKLLNTAMNGILYPEKTPANTESSAAAKEAYSALATFLLEAAKVDADAASVSSVLEECRFSPERMKAVLTLYNEKRLKLRESLERVASIPPHIVDVDWRLDYFLKDNHVERVNKAEYIIEVKSSSNDTLQFAATQEQVQELVFKLKDAAKTLDKYKQ